MTDKIDIPASPNYFPLTPMIETGLWAALTPAARAVLGVVWDFHRRFPDACHPSRERLARDAGVSPPTVTRAVRELEDRGVLEVIAAHGLSSNTYVVRWSGISPPQKVARRSTRTTPFGRQADHSETFLSDDPTKQYGSRRVVVSRSRERRRHVMADGCVLFSGREATLHEWLREWKIPHLCSVPYNLLGIRGLHPASTVDFVVAPRVLIEVWGLPSSQKSARSYQEKRRRKEAAIKQAGWTLLGIEAGKGPSEALFPPICDCWASSTVEDAERLLNLLRHNENFTPPDRCLNLWEQHIDHAQQRRAGTMEPATPTGLYKTEWITDNHGGRYEKLTPTRPQVYLEVAAGRVASVKPLPTTPQRPAAAPPAPTGPQSLGASGSMKIPYVFGDSSRNGDADEPPVSEEVLDRMQRLEDRIGELEDLLDSSRLGSERRKELEDELRETRADLSALNYRH